MHAPVQVARPVAAARRRVAPKDAVHQEQQQEQQQGQHREQQQRGQHREQQQQADGGVIVLASNLKAATLYPRGKPKCE